MQVKCKKLDGVWVCFLNPYGDGWYQFGQGKTRRLSISDAMNQFKVYNHMTDSNH